MSTTIETDYRSGSASRAARARLGRPARIRRLALRTALGRTIAASVVAVAILMAALSIQMSLGQDPALGPKVDAQRRSIGLATVAVSQQPLAPPPTPVTTSAS